MKYKPSKALTFFLSFCTGVGHLYLGAMNRGLQFLILFFGSFAMIGFLPLRMFPFWIPIIWFYGLFDALQLADQEEILDKPLLEWKHLRGHWAGFIFIALGLLMIIDNTLPALWNAYLSDIFLGWVSIRTLIMALFLIVIGIFMLKGRRVHNDERAQ